MRRLALLLLLAGCSPAAPPAAPRRTGVDSRAFVGEAELVVSYRYTPLPHFEIELTVDLSARGGEVGEIAVLVKPEGFDVVRGPLEWTVSLDEGDDHSEGVRLRAAGPKTPNATVVTSRGDGGAELATDTLHFIIEDELVRECRATDSACTR